MIARSLQWKATSQRNPMAAARPSGGTATATSVTTWLIRLVPCRTVPTVTACSIVAAECMGLSTVLRRCSNSGSVKVAVVGAGISGLGAAYLVSRAHDVELFERDAKAGGHVNTFEHRGLGLDTGFIVHNEPNYPYLNR